MSDLTYSAEQIQQLLRCPVCLDRYREPKLLPCQHTFCLRPCLEGLVDRSTRSIRCPECRAEHRLPNRGISGLPNNLTIISFLDLPAPSQSGNSPRDEDNAIENSPGSGPQETRCVACNQTDAVSRCPHCENQICDRCQLSHALQSRQDIGRLINQIRRGLPRLSESISTTEQRAEGLKLRCEAVCTEVQGSVERLIKELKSRQLILLSELNTFLLGEQQCIRQAVETLELEVATAASFCDSTEASLGRSDEDILIGDLVSLRHQCSEHLESIRNSSNASSIISLGREPRYHHDTSPVANLISNFGELVVTNPESTSSIPRNLNNRTTAFSDIPSSRLESTTPAFSHSPGRNISRYLRRLPVNGSTSSSYNRFPSSTSFDVGLPPYSNQSSRNGLWDTLPASSSQRRNRPRDRNNSDRMAGFLGMIGNSSPRSQQEHPSPSSPENTPSQSRRRWNRHATVRPIEMIDVAEDNGSLGSQRIQASPAVNAAANPQTSTLERRRPVPAAVRFDIAIDESLGDLTDELENTITFRYSTGDSNFVSTPRNNYEQKGRSTLRFGERGNSDNQFTWPRGIAVTSSNDILVADSSNHRIQVFNDCGCYVKTIGSYGQGEGELDCLAGIATDSDGNIIVSDRYNNRIQVFTHDGSFSRAFGEEGQADGQFNYPWGVACDTDKNIFVCDKDNHRIQVFSQDGTFLRKFGRLGNRAGMFDSPNYVAISEDNRVFVTDTGNHRIQVFSNSGDFLFTFGVQGTQRGQVKFPKGIIVDDQGFVLVADSGNNRVQVFRQDGRFYCMFGSWGSENGHFKGLEGLAIMPNGNVVVSDRENHRIQVF